MQTNRILRLKASRPLPWLWLIIAIMLMVDTAAAQDKPERALLAIVSGDSIFTTDIDAVFAKMHSSMSAVAKNDFDYHKLLNKLVNDRLIVHEAEALGMADDEVITALLTKRKQNWIKALYIKNNFAPDTTVTEESLLAYFRNNYHKVQVRTLSIEKRATADSLIAQIRQGASMDSLAKARSVDMFRYVGGLQSFKYWITIENDLRQYLTGAAKGTMIGPFPYREVYAIMRVEETAASDTSELGGMRDYLTSLLRDVGKDKAWTAFVDALRGHYDLSIDSTALGEIAGSTKSVLDSTFQRSSERPMASILGAPVVTERKLRQETAHSAMSQGTTAIDTLLYQSLNKLIEDAVLYRAGLDAKFDSLAWISRRLAATEDSALIEIYLQETVVSRIKFNLEEFQQYYDEHQEEFREPDQLSLRQVLIEGQERADSSVALLQDGADFDYVVDKYRKGSKELSEQTVNSSMNAFPKTIQEDLAKLTPGQSSKTYPTSEGWIIFKLLDRKPGRLKTLEDVDINIREVMFQRKFAAMLDETLAQLKANSDIVMFEKAIEKYLGAGN